MSQDLTVSKYSDCLRSVVGLSGGIGCGKSTALKIFAELGCDIIESDKLCHELYNDKDIQGVNFRDEIINRWGESILSRRKIDRRKIGQIVFNNKTELEWLNKTVHPEVFNKACKLISSFNNKSTIVFDVPLLFELGIEKHFAATITIWTNKEQQYERLENRGWTKAEIQERLASQLSSDIKLERATFGIINTGALTLLYEQCRQILINIEKGNRNDTGK